MRSDHQWGTCQVVNLRNTNCTSELQKNSKAAKSTEVSHNCVTMCFCSKQCIAKHWQQPGEKFDVEKLHLKNEATRNEISIPPEKGSVWLFASIWKKIPRKTKSRVLRPPNTFLPANQRAATCHSISNGGIPNLETPPTHPAQQASHSPTGQAQWSTTEMRSQSLASRTSPNSEAQPLFCKAFLPYWHLVGSGHCTSLVGIGHNSG